jgi:hypothetical protein
MAYGGRRVGAGRKKGTPNKFTADLKEMILEAAERAGGRGGAVAYLERQANANPTAFLALLGRTLPREEKVEGNVGVNIVKEIMREIDGTTRGLDIDKHAFAPGIGPGKPN